MDFKYSEQCDAVKQMLPLFEKDILNETYLDEFYRDFGCNSKEELNIKIDSAIDFNNHTLNRIILHPTEDYYEIEQLYLRYMALSPNEKMHSDAKARKIFGMTNIQIYDFVKDHVVRPEQETDTNKHSVETEIEPSDSLFSNDLPLLTPEELTHKIDEDYSCFTEAEGKIIQAWREEYALLGNGIKSPSYDLHNLQRINILRNAIYENNTNAILQCGWIPGIEFNSENRVKASKIIKEKMEVFNIEEGLLNQDDVYLNYDKWNTIDNNILFITGTAGSGKTTLADRLAKENNAEVIHLDYVSIACIKGSEWINNKKPSVNESVHLLDKEFVNSNPNLKWSNMTESEQEETMQMYLEWLVKRCTDKLYIVEGTHIATNPKFKEKYSNRPLIILGVGQLTSYIRKVSRRIKGFNFNNCKRDLSGIIKIATNIKDISVNDKIISDFRNTMIHEAKSFPVQFDKEGNLILKNIKKLDFEQEYANSHRLLKEYEKTDSYEPMKFELAKMQFFITLLEKRIFKNGKSNSINELKVRARFLNDFKKYLKIISTNEPSFNFTEYYEQTPFNDALIKVDKDTLKYGFKALKYAIKG